MRTVVLVGIPGCGKSTILKEIHCELPSVAIINYGDQMLEEANMAGIERDMLRKMPIASQQEIGIRTAKRIMQNNHMMAVIDTHALIKTKAGYIPGLPKEILKILSPLALAWIECPPFLILQRRKNDPSRTRDEEPEDALQRHQELTRSYLTACSMETGALLCQIDNSSPSIENNCQPFIHLMKHWINP